jgi:hypothetical protein
VRRRVVAIILVSLVVGGSCGDDDTSTTTTAADAVTTTTAADAMTTTTGSAGDDEAPPTLDLDNLSLYLEPLDTSYRMTLVFHFVAETPSGTVDGTQEVDGGKLLEPLTYELTGRAEGDATGPQCFAFHSLPGFVDPYAAFLDEGGMLMGEATLLAEGLNVNGRNVDRYLITIDNIDPADDAGSEVDELEEAYIDVDRQGGFVVQLVLNGRGRSALLTGQPSLVGDIDYDLDFTEFGTITELRAPEGC